MTQADINALRRFVDHMERVFRDFPQLPPTVSNRTYNAYRLAKKELARVGKILENETKTQNDDEERTHNTAAG